MPGLRHIPVYLALDKSSNPTRAEIAVVFGAEVYRHNPSLCYTTFVLGTLGFEMVPHLCPTKLQAVGQGTQVMKGVG